MGKAFSHPLVCAVMCMCMWVAGVSLVMKQISGHKGLIVCESCISLIATLQDNIGGALLISSFSILYF